ncbi:alpha/beta hydrolase family protein [Chitinophaga tropicalis]|uniref:Prolyl oligopeptidase family serine peptidase n=1 Tax=Chitinophaga tropicalis TaxID=2683588 RepID=A0A7K1U7P0_9BACT|nr:prolyl oligopeptidase family serine peptidase [Chitinophaga tropicalis]MVT10378.1 prolyl oligopeptidase family serine peptidase [Chitinophaga tropicalis]
MNRILFPLIFLWLFSNALYAQKREIDFHAIKYWQRLGKYGISANGKKVFYESISGSNIILTVCDINGSNKKEYRNAYNAAFTNDSRFLFFNTKDTLHQISLLTGKDSTTVGITDLHIPGGTGRRWLTYMKGGDLILRDYKTETERNYGKVVNFKLNQQGTVLLLQRDSGICWVDLSNNKSIIIYRGDKIRKMAFNPKGNRIVFLSGEDNAIELFRYQPDYKYAQILARNSSEGIMSGFTLAEHELEFSANNELVMCQLERQERKLSPDSLLITKDVDIWSYKDDFLQSQQLNILKGYLKRQYHMVVSYSSGKVLQLENDSMILIGKPGNTIALVKTYKNEDETYWNQSQVPFHRIISLKDGRVIDSIPGNGNIYSIQLSPSGKYITWFDKTDKSFFCYEIKTNRVRRLLPGFIYEEDNPEWNDKITPFIVFDWTDEDRSILVYDKYDIWQIDPLFKTVPVCLTGKYGRRHHIAFRLIAGINGKNVLRERDTVVAAILSDADKYNGFYSLSLNTENSIGNLSLQPYLYYFPGQFASLPPPAPRRAENTSMFILQRQSDREAPNVVVTSDFRNFLVISDLHPEHDYKWHKAELLHWKSDDGRVQRGVLYMPEQLDTLKEYPIIFNYYEESSDERFKYKMPGLSAVNVNIPWYVSRDYLIFVPDIIRRKGENGRSALITVESAAKMLTNKYAWINKGRMGLQGQSFGGTMTNYIITHSSLFAAAQSNAGRSDFVSGFGGIGFGDKSLQNVHEIGQNFLGTTPWEGADIYIENSPVFSIEKVVTPLLIRHNQADQAVNFSQGIELFTALRRAGKKVWLLQYDQETHIMSDGNERSRDFSIRQQQFFDHYLKKRPAPLWMIEGVPATLKGIRSGLEIDTQARVP